MHISYEAGILEDPAVIPPKRMWLMTTGKLILFNDLFAFEIFWIIYVFEGAKNNRILPELILKTD